MKRDEVSPRSTDTPPGERPAIARDSRPPETTESTSRHVFTVEDGRYRCARCGREMTDTALDERCPAGE